MWLAVAEGRGHLMRAQLASRLLAPAGIDVEIVTTSPAGAAFIAELGGAATVMSTGYRLIYDERQNLARVRTRMMAMRYLASPSRCLRDLSWLGRRARSAALVVNDSFHPALLAASLVGADLADRVVHLHGENTRRAVEDGAGRGPMGRMVRRALASARRIEITLGERVESEPGVYRLPPLLPTVRPPSVVRGERGVPDGKRLAVVYLNPYFHDHALAAAIEGALDAAGYAVHAVGEGYAGRPGWRARDRSLGEVIAAADLFVSAAGNGALALARASGVPMIALATDQPEQRRNLTSIADPHGGWRRVVELDRDVGAQLAAAIAEVPRRPRAVDPALAVHRSRALWLHALTTLVETPPT